MLDTTIIAITTIVCSTAVGIAFFAMLGYVAAKLGEKK